MTSHPPSALIAHPPASSPPPGEPDRSLRLSVWEGAWSRLHESCVGGAIVTAFALMLHASDFHLALLSALALVATVGTVVSARVVGHLGERKRLVFHTAAASRLLWLIPCALPFVVPSDAVALAVLLATVFILNLAINVSGNAWLSWMTDLVPAERRGRYFSIRNSIIGAVGMATGPLAGKAFDVLKAHGVREPWLFIPFFAAAAVIGVAAATLYRRQWEPPLRGEVPLPVARIFRLPFAHPDFRRLLRFTALWGMLAYVAAPFFVPHMMCHDEEGRPPGLDMPMSVIALYGVFSGAGVLLMQPLWGRIVDRVGNRPVLVFNLIGVGVLPWLWLPATKDFWLPIWIDAVLSGIFWPGFTLALFNLVLHTAPQENRTSYLAMHTLVTGFAQCAAALIGGAIAHVLHDFKVTAGGLTFTHYHVLFFLAGAGRFVLLPLALRLREDGAGSVGLFVGLCRDKAVQVVAEGWETGMTMLRRLAKGQDERPPRPPAGTQDE